MSPARARRPARRAKRSRRRRRRRFTLRRLLIAGATAALAASAAIAWLVHSARPPAPQPFRFPLPAADQAAAPDRGGEGGRDVAPTAR